MSSDEEMPGVGLSPSMPQETIKPDSPPCISTTEETVIVKEEEELIPSATLRVETEQVCLVDEPDNIVMKEEESVDAAEIKDEPLSSHEEEVKVSHHKKKRKMADAEVINSQSESCSDSNSYQRKTRRATFTHSITITLSSDESSSESVKNVNETDESNSEHDEYNPQSVGRRKKKKPTKLKPRVFPKLHRSHHRSFRGRSSARVPPPASERQPMRGIGSRRRFGRKRYFNSTRTIHHHQKMFSPQNDKPKLFPRRGRGSFLRHVKTRGFKRRGRPPLKPDRVGRRLFRAGPSEERGGKTKKGKSTEKVKKKIGRPRKVVVEADHLMNVEEKTAIVQPASPNIDDVKESEGKNASDMSKEQSIKTENILPQKKRGRPTLTDKHHVLTTSTVPKDKPSSPTTAPKEKVSNPSPTKIKMLAMPTIATSKLKVKKKHLKPFMQIHSCCEIDPKLSKCRECRIFMYNKNKKSQNSYCRFLEYRKLYMTKNGSIGIAGFSAPSDATHDDLRPWLPRPDQPPSELNIDTCKSLLVQVGDQFCDLIEQEKEAFALHIGTENKITWKKIVPGVRELCDVCDTTIFNLHWVCPKCGLAVCIDCYKVRKQGIIITDEENPIKGVDEYSWLLCTGRVEHKLENMIMAQILPGNVLEGMQRAVHRVRDQLNIVSYCKCVPRESHNNSTNEVSTGICKPLISSVSKMFSAQPPYKGQFQSNDIDFSSNNVDCDDLDVHVSENAMNWLYPSSPWQEDQSMDSAHKNNNLHNGNSREQPEYNTYCRNNDLFPSCLTLDLNSSDSDEFHPFAESHFPLRPLQLLSTTRKDSRVYTAFPCEEVLKGVKEWGMHSNERKEPIKTFISRFPLPTSGRDPLPIRIFTSEESNMSHPNVPHSWLCNGRLLLLHQPDHSQNLELFQEQWRRGQPIMVQRVDKRLDMTLWHPNGFCQDFGEIKNDLVNCKTGAVISNLPMKRFWEGFENFEQRMKDEQGEYMLLKLKDWPPGEDFSEKLPKRFHDLMKALPLPEYTHRDGIFNLAGRLPQWFVRPDLGPKMYNAYGSALYPSKGTTNLHLDISDAVNVMVYVGVPNGDIHIQEALKAIDEGGCDALMAKRVREADARPGALWHIFNARDADKIRDMLNKVAQERGEKLEAHNDPIHDQSWYIDAPLQSRLYHEYGVEGYAIAQCLGDAVFIPAGAPHQVRNLHSCVKVAEDFVSPENIGHCFNLTQEFRRLSHTHTNHEDKLQIKNIIYHVVRDSLSCLIDAENMRIYGLDITN